MHARTPRRRPPLRPGWSAPLIRLLSTPTEDTPLTDDELRAMREKHDVLLVPREPQTELAPLLAALLSGHAADVRAKDAEHWLLMRDPMPEAARPLTDVLAERPDAFPAILLAVLEGFHELHTRGVILNEGARASRQFLVPGEGGAPADRFASLGVSPHVAVGWDVEWATVVDPEGAVEDAANGGSLSGAKDFGGSPSGAKDFAPAPFVLCASGDPCAHYPARDLLWFLSDLPADLDLGPAGDILVAIAWHREAPETSVAALAPLAKLRRLGLPKGWEAHATPVGGPVVSLAGPEPQLVRDGWGVQMCGAAAAAVRRNRSGWATEDLEDALRGLGFASPLALLRDMAGERDLVLVQTAAPPWEEEEGDAATPPVKLDLALRRATDCPSLSELGQSGGRRRPAGSASFQSEGALTAAGPAQEMEAVSEGEGAEGGATPSVGARARAGARQLLNRLISQGNVGRVAPLQEEREQDEGDETQGRLRSVLDFFGVSDMK
jgi:hypothetical protein